MIVVTANQMQAMDRQTIEVFGIPGRTLMESAGRGATRHFLERIYRGGSVGILAGRGNNGGDGFVMARYLASRDIPVTVFLLSQADKVQGDAAANLKLLSALKVPVMALPDAEHFRDQHNHMRHMTCWIDALLGTGLKADVQGYFREAIEFLNSLQRPIFAVDMPSGLNADTGQPCGACIKAAATATFGFAKIGQVVHPGVQQCGELAVIDIGIPPNQTIDPDQRHHLITAQQVHTLLGERPIDAHKGRTGHALIVAGATGKTGAAAMTTTAALRAGAGLVTLGVPESLNAILETQVTEAMTLPLPDQGTGQILEEAFDEILQAADAKQALALGPGLGTASHTRNLVMRMIKEIDIPMVIDADGLNNLAGHLGWLQGRKSTTVLTPHPGEMARLSGLTIAQIQQNRVAAARKLAMDNKVYLVLKGARTLVAGPDGDIWINPTGNSGMATGGMGDVLTGLITGLLAQGYAARDASIAGVFLHGLSADLIANDRPRGYLATEVMNTIPHAIGQLHRLAENQPLPTYLG